MLNRSENKSKMMNDSLKVNQNEDGSFSLEWDRQDPNWKFLNDLTSKEIQVIIDQAIKYDNDSRTWSQKLFTWKLRDVELIDSKQSKEILEIPLKDDQAD